MTVVLIGAGGHAKVVYDALLAIGHAPSQIMVRAEKPSEFMGKVVETPEIPVDAVGNDCHVAIGANETRQTLIERLGTAKASPLLVVHPRADISSSAMVGAGTFVAANACVAALAKLDEGVIVNHGAVVDHDCSVGRAAHIAPGAVLGGSAQVGRLTLIGANATVLPGLHIGNNVIVGAGSVVSKDIPNNRVWIGKSLLHKERGF